LHWVYGISDVPSNMVNLSDDQNDRVVYAAAHTAVIYDKNTGAQTFLQVRTAWPKAELLVMPDFAGLFHVHGISSVER